MGASIYRRGQQYHHDDAWTSVGRNLKGVADRWYGKETAGVDATTDKRE